MSAIELISQMSSTVASDGDSDQHKAILTALSKLPKPPDDLLRLFDRGTHYSLHGRDAHVVADEYFKSSSCVRFSGEDRSPYLSINKTMGAEIIRSALMTQRRRVEVYSAAGGGWSLERRGSPGNLQAFEEECLRDGDLAMRRFFGPRARDVFRVRSQGWTTSDSLPKLKFEVFKLKFEI